MSNYIRKIRRNFLKKRYGTNKIRDIYHEERDTIEKIFKRKRGEKNNETRTSNES